MATIRVYRYANEDYADGQTIRPCSDHFDRLDATRKDAELALRAVSTEAEAIRKTSLYTWADERLARRLWPRSHSKFLYELEVDEASVLHRGDVSHFWEAQSALKRGGDAGDAVNRYWSGEAAGTPYVEVLLSEAKVIRKLQGEG